MARRACDVAESLASLNTEPVTLADEPVYTDTYVSSYEVDPFSVAEEEKIQFLLSLNDRTLASKPTKAAAESKRIATDKIEKAITRLDRLKAVKPHPAEARIFPLNFAPIVMQVGDRKLIRLARYHCRKPHEPAFIDRKLPGLYNARRDSLGKYWREQFGASHAVMMVESFFENVDRDGKNQVLHFIPRPAGTMLIA